LVKAVSFGFVWILFLNFVSPRRQLLVVIFKKIVIRSAFDMFPSNSTTFLIQFMRGLKLQQGFYANEDYY